MGKAIVISGIGLYAPPDKISNQELVDSFNFYIENYNLKNKTAIQEGKVIALQPSSTSFIEKASGIQYRHVIDKKGILDSNRMRPSIQPRQDDVPSIQCEMACLAIHQALDHAQKKPEEIDGLIVSCSNTQRAYPAMAIEIQKTLGTKGYALDMNVACSSSTFGIAMAFNALNSGQNQCMVVVNPEIPSSQLNFRDRDCHFIFGDACTATVIENQAPTTRPGFEITGIKLQTEFSSNIRNNTGFLNAAEIDIDDHLPYSFFKQNGRKVFKEVIPMVEEHILAHLASLNLTPDNIQRFWLHQANLNMNELIIKKILGREARTNEAPMILDKYANTASCGSLIAFHEYHHDLKPGDLGLICSFGAGYSIGSIVVKKQ